MKKPKTAEEVAREFINGGAEVMKYVQDVPPGQRIAGAEQGRKQPGTPYRPSWMKQAK